METKNVSAQLYFKQLPEDRSAASYNCEDTYPDLSTCVNNVETDTAIENAFQKQLNLSEYYKSPEVFEAIKDEFMDQTMEAENSPEIPLIDQSQEDLPPPPSVPEKIPSGPTDFLIRLLNKSSFGISEYGKYIMIFILILIIGGLIFLAPKLCSKKVEL